MTVRLAFPGLQKWERAAAWQRKFRKWRALRDTGSAIELKQDKQKSSRTVPSRSWVQVGTNS
ncbi:MAG: hypothetical protein ACHQ9S_27380 [Candidatus Binatia bacterium]